MKYSETSDKSYKRELDENFGRNYSDTEPVLRITVREKKKHREERK